MSEYTKAAADFLDSTGTKFRATRTANNACPMWCDGKHIHGAQYRATFTRDGARFSLNFWNSYQSERDGKGVEAYDVLACLTKSDPGTFSDFCSEYGYDEDSRKAEKTYKAVCKEWEKVEGFFSSDELEQLQEIQ